MDLFRLAHLSPATSPSNAGDASCTGLWSSAGFEPPPHVPLAVGARGSGLAIVY